MFSFLRSLLEGLRAVKSNSSGTDQYSEPSQSKLARVSAKPRDQKSARSFLPTQIHYDYLFENINDAIFIHDLAGRFLAVNQVACQRLGYSREELLQMDVKQLNTPERVAQFEQGLPKLLQHGNRIIESCHRCKDGTVIPVEINARLIEYNGAPAVLSVARDISARKRAKEALKKSEATWKALLNAIADSALLIDRAGTILSLNENAALSLGKPIDELLGTCVYDVLPPELAKQRRLHADSVYRSGKPVRFEDARAERYFEHTLCPVLDAEGQVIQVAIYAQDTTERKRAIEALEHAEERYRNTFENAIDGIFQSTPDGRYLSVNPAMARIFGYASPDEMIASVGNDIGQKLYADPSRRIEFKRLLEEQGVLRDYQIQKRRKDGTIIWTSTNARTVRDASGNLLYYEGFIENINERKRAEETVHYQANLLSQVSDAVISTDSQFRVVSWNHSAEQMYGWRADEIMGKSLPELVAGEYPGTTRAQVLREFGEQGWWKGEVIHHRKDGSPMYLLSSVSVFKDNAGKAIGIVSVNRDITDRKRAEEKTVKLAERLNLATRGARIGIWDWDIQKNELIWDDRMYELYGVKREDFSGAYQAWLNGLHPDDRAHSDEISAQARRGERDYDTEFRVVLPDGTIRALKAYGDVIRDSASNPARMIGVNFDITERKQAEDALKASEEKFKAQYKGIPIPTITWKKVGDAFVLIDYNDAAVAFTHGQVENFLGKKHGEMYHDEPAIRADMTRCFDGRTSFQRELSVQLRSTYEFVTLIASYTFIPPDLVVCHAEDITQRNRTELALRDSEARYRNLMEQAVDGIAVIDASGKYVDVNSTGCEMLGYTRAEFLTKTIADILAPGSLEQLPIPFAEMREGKAVVLERVMRRKDGSLFPAEVRTKMLPDGRFHGIFTDISERKRLEAEVQTMLAAQQKWNAELEDKVRAKTAELQQLSEMRDQLLRQMITAQEEERRRVARELHDETSQALTALIANLAIVQTLSPAKAKTHLDEIKTSIAETLKGVNRIVLDLRPTLLDDYGLMPALSWYANKRVGSGTHVEVTVPEPELRLPSEAETILFRIGQEAISNVANHSKASWIHIDLFSNPVENEITLEIRDNGAGFDTERFRQQTTNAGLHLGLLGMQERIGLVGGKLRIQSKPGKGTLIAATVPFKPPVNQE